MANEASNYIRVTEEARRKENQLESIGYLHSNYERFKEISNYNNVTYVAKINQLAKVIIQKQINREKEIYKELGVNNVNELTKKFLGDEGLQYFISNNYDNIRKVMATALKESFGNSSLQQKVNKTNKKEIEKTIQNSFDKSLQNLSKEYQDNLSKILNNKGIGKEMILTLEKISNRDKNNKLKNAQQITSGAFSQWKGSLLEQCIALFVSQLNHIKGVEVTGSSLDSFGKFIKSDVTAFTENMTIGFSAKNYKMRQNKKGEWELDKSLSLHSKGSFENFLNRIESLKNTDLDKYLSNIGKTFRSDNYYYNLINEAVQKTSFQSSKPAEDFLLTVKELAAAWFGTQLTTNTKDENNGQMVDFFIIGNKGFIPMSVLLIALQEESAKINATITSTANIDEDSIYEKKIESPYTSEGLYSSYVQNIGFYAGQEVYSGIKISEIKLNLILKNFI